MINEIKKDAQERMQKSVESLAHNFGRIRTGQAHPSILEGVMVPYYGSDTPDQASGQHHRQGRPYPASRCFRAQHAGCRRQGDR